jgi:hypothetical protein
MKKILLPLAIVVLLELATPVFAELELGISGTPYPNPQTGNTMDMLIGFHVGYAWSGLYGSWDSIAVPNFMVQNWTGGYYRADGTYVLGYNVPGFLNLYDVGIRLVLRPLVGLVEVGVNSLYVYQVGLLDTGLGANLRLGLGLKLHRWGIMVTGTSVFGSWDDLTTTLSGLFSDTRRKDSLNRIENSLVPSFQLTIYF